MKLFQKLAISFVSILALVGVFEIAQAAKPPRFAGVQSRGIRSVNYFISGSASNIGAINSAKHNWMYTGWDNPLYMYQRGNNYETAIDFYGGAIWDGVGGVTEFYDGANRGIALNGNAPGRNFYWAKVTLNTKYRNERAMTSGTVAKHEIGHALGLAHALGNDSSSIMQPTIQKTTVRNVDKGASDKLTDVYGWYW
ncbi:Matrixin [Pilibacter termitis]|uniref:Matrixin n=1 Tax=Pilibacter termitis TaxID=263852 RepID=A0A1T4PVE8_9ENTE|nr:matrixin family metalloprotease [Pilibacter termitis]SJZ95493.1 Matrixin [Pilibacter termitis]